MQTRKQRQGPSSSATLFAVGTIRTGNDGKKWRIETNKNAVKRWVRVGGTAVTRKVKPQTTKNFSSNTHPKDYVSFDVLVKQSKDCQETDDCNLFINENLLDDIWWKMFNPNTAAGEYDTAIPFRGPPESLKAALALVKAEYGKIKAKGDISKFKIDLSSP